MISPVRGSVVALGQPTSSPNDTSAATRLYDAEIALHIARQTGVDSWVAAAYDRLHLAIDEHRAARRAC